MSASEHDDFLGLFSKGQSLLQEHDSESVATSVLAEDIRHRYDLTPSLAEGVAKDILAGEPASYQRLTGASGRETTDASLPLHKSIVLKADAEGPVIYGPASVDIVDKEDERIGGAALKDGLNQLLKRGRFSLEHMDILVGEIRPEMTVGDDTYKSEVREVTKEDLEQFPKLKASGVEVGDDALFVVGKIYDKQFDEDVQSEVIKEIQSGELDSFSISGKAVHTSETMDCDGYECKQVREIEKLDLHSVTICSQGMNPASSFVVLSKSWDSWTPKTSSSTRKACGCDGLSAHDGPCTCRDKQRKSASASSRLSAMLDPILKDDEPEEPGPEEALRDAREYLKRLGVAIDQRDLQEIQDLAGMIEDHAEQAEDVVGKQWRPVQTRSGNVAAENTQTGERRYGEDAERVLQGGGVEGGDVPEPAMDINEEFTPSERVVDVEEDVVPTEPEAATDDDSEVRTEDLAEGDMESAEWVEDNIADQPDESVRVAAESYLGGSPETQAEQRAMEATIEEARERGLIDKAAVQSFRLDLILSKAQAGRPEDAEELGFRIGNPGYPTGNYQFTVSPSDQASTDVEWGEEEDYSHPGGSDRLDDSAGPWNEEGDRAEGYHTKAEDDDTLEDEEVVQKPAPEGVDPETFDRCVAQVSDAGDAENAHAVCAAQLQKAPEHPPSFVKTMLKVGDLGELGHKVAFVKHGFDAYRRDCPVCNSVAKQYRDPHKVFDYLSKFIEDGVTKHGRLFPGDRTKFKRERDDLARHFPLNLANRLERQLDTIA